VRQLERAEAIDGETVAAMAPGVVAACTAFARAAGRGAFATAVLELADAVAIVTSLPPDLLLAIVLRPRVGFAPLLAELGPYRVTLVPDGRAALEALEGDEPIDLVLLDIMMPHMSGLEVLARLREVPRWRSTPVIMLTAKGQDGDRKRALEIGATDFLTKPFSPNKLLARIDELFK
jgi:CheY-like chemotaxis protein